MATKEDGGPAFPTIDHTESGYPYCANFGLSLRDWFAAHAPAPPKWWMDSFGRNTQDLGEYADVLTQWSYAYADSMIAARQK